MLRIRGRFTVLASAAVTAVVLPLAGAAPARAEAPKESCDIVYGGNIVSYAMTCSQPGEPMIGGFATWRNVPIAFDKVDTPNTTVMASNYLRVTPNTESSPLAYNIEIGLYAEKTGKTTQTYGPKWTELGKNGGKTKAITAGVNPTKPDERNHTYMLVRQETGNQWDVLYDFNKTGSTTDQLKVPGGNPNRIDIGLEVMGHQYVDVPEIADRMQFMDGNQTWQRVDSSNTAKIITLGTCSATKKPPNCFNAKLTDATSFTQWTVGKPRKAPPAPAASAEAQPHRTSELPPEFNGVDQHALQDCLEHDAADCLTTVPGLSDCVLTTRVCNAAALESAPSTTRTTAVDISASSIRERAAAAFDVDPQDMRVVGSPRAEGVSVADTSPQTWTVESAQTTPGLEHQGRSFKGFRAVYSAHTGQLLEACWGQLCRS